MLASAIASVLGTCSVCQCCSLAGSELSHSKSNVQNNLIAQYVLTLALPYSPLLGPSQHSGIANLNSVTEKEAPRAPLPGSYKRFYCHSEH
jgi:hypothetical protein